jgi:uncharacterized protein (DUF488 family)
MSPSTANHTPAIFTAGFSNLPLETFLGNMLAHGVQVVADVRSKPFSSYCQHFNRDNIEAAVRAARLGYVYLGGEMGGLPDDACFYDDEGYVRYDRIAATSGFQEGVRRIMDGLSQGLRIALCCGEGDPRECHRRLLIGRVLRERGVGVAHILSDGGLVAEAELQDEERNRPTQLTLFGTAPEPEWRSARPRLRVDSSLAKDGRGHDV